jgi:hypothetical protein
MVDASLASPTHPSRPPPVTKSFAPFYFLTRPSEFLYTHVPLLDHRHQHVVSQGIIYPAIQLALPYACAAFFQNDLTLESDFDGAQTRLDGLQVACIDLEIPEDVECVAEVESQAYARDLEGDLFESGETIHEQALTQPLWLDGGQRRVYRVKGFLSGEGARGALKVYAGKKGLMVKSPFMNRESNSPRPPPSITLIVWHCQFLYLSLAATRLSDFSLDIRRPMPRGTIYTFASRSVANFESTKPLFFQFFRVHPPLRLQKRQSLQSLRSSHLVARSLN